MSPKQSPDMASGLSKVVLSIWPQASVWGLQYCEEMLAEAQEGHPMQSGP